LFNVSADFSADPAPEARVTLPGDDMFASLMLAAKCLVHKGSLVVENVCLESWCGQLLQSLRAMGCNIAVQQTGECSFGAVGNAVVQKFSPSGRKVECTPCWQYSSPLPAMTVTAAFAQCQSIFRGIEDLRLDEPDGIGRIGGCLAALGARYGEMPDGLVVEGAKQYDGFDICEELPAPLAGAFAVAGLKCRGKTTIADRDLLRRWPDFEKLLSSVCEFKE
jgi:5-enolpyruvylshikimate-3-phosphate synthase